MGSKLFIILVILSFLIGLGHVVYAEVRIYQQPIYQIEEFDPETQSYDDFKKDDYILHDIRIDSKFLILNVEYGGGCKEHEFKLRWDGSSRESNPPIVLFALYHDGKGDGCKAIVQKELRFDVSQFEGVIIEVMNYYGGETLRLCNFDVSKEKILRLCPNSAGNFSGGTYCPDDVKICADGSIVTRSFEKNCEFYACSDSLAEECETEGIRKDGKYCSNDKTWQKQKEANDFCENNFECKSNFCLESKCVSKGLLRKIIDWISSIFGF